MLTCIVSRVLLLSVRISRISLLGWRASCKAIDSRYLNKCSERSGGPAGDFLIRSSNLRNKSFQLVAGQFVSALIRGEQRAKSLADTLRQRSASTL